MDFVCRRISRAGIWNVRRVLKEPVERLLCVVNWQSGPLEWHHCRVPSYFLQRRLSLTIRSITLYLLTTIHSGSRCHFVEHIFDILASGKFWITLHAQTGRLRGRYIGLSFSLMKHGFGIYDVENTFFDTIIVDSGLKRCIDRTMVRPLITLGHSINFHTKGGPTINPSCILASRNQDLIAVEHRI